MPFDFVSESETAFVWPTELLRLRALRDALRQPLPDDFTWEWSSVLECGRMRSCGRLHYYGCGKGLAMHLKIVPASYVMEPVAGQKDALGLTLEEHLEVFYNRGTNRDFGGFKFWGPYGVNSLNITPAMVADEIDKLLAKKLREHAELLAGA